MRPKLGRPNIARYSNRFSVPTARSDAPLSVTWMGVATLLVDDGSSALMTDGYFSRPGLARVAAGKVSPSAERVDGCLARANVSRLTAVIPVHTHIDHAMDSALSPTVPEPSWSGGSRRPMSGADTGCLRSLLSSPSQVNQSSWAPST